MFDRPLFRFLCAAFLTVAVVAAAGRISVITLKDQSVIRGEILEMKDNVYRVKTPTMGEVKIPADQIQVIMAEDAQPVPQPVRAAPQIRLVPVRPAVGTPAIREGKPRAPAHVQRPAGNAAPQGDPQADPNPSVSQDLKRQQDEVQGRVQSMMMDPNYMQKITNLGQNQEMQEIMSDPEVMNAIQTMDYNALMNNEKMQRLMETPEIRDLLGSGE